jgi:hypothetical protein
VGRVVEKELGIPFDKVNTISEISFEKPLKKRT